MWEGAGLRSWGCIGPRMVVALVVVVVVVLMVSKEGETSLLHVVSHTWFHKGGYNGLRRTSGALKGFSKLL